MVDSEDEFEDKTMIAEVSEVLRSKPKAASMASLVQYTGADVGKRYLIKGESIRVGRSANSDLALSDASVSRSHAVLTVDKQGGVTIEDTGSANGTYVNQSKLAGPHRLADQDMISLGAVQLKFFARDNVDGFVQDKIYKLATIDAGTQIFNKQYLQDALYSEFRTAQASGRPLSIIYFDLDFFKKVNDTYGHAAGDQVLVETVALVKSVIRKSDVFARIGGEEFVVVLPKTTLQDAATVAEGIRQAVLAHVYQLKVDGKASPVAHLQTVSSGVAQADKSMSDYKALLEAADKKLYTSKTSGRNKVTV